MLRVCHSTGALALYLAASAAAQCQYEFIPIYEPGPNPGSISLRCISESGWSGGQLSAQGRPVLVDPSRRVILLDAPPGESSVQAIALDGSVYGELQPVGQNQLPCVWINGVPQTLPTPIPIRSGSVNDVNEAGWVAGSVSSSSLLISGPCVWTESGVLTPYDVISGSGVGVDNAGNVVGWAIHPETGSARGYSWRDGRVTWLPLPTRMISSRVYGASHAGHICGECWSETVTATVATVWRMGTPTLLEVPLTYTRTRSIDVNSLGQVIGTAEKPMASTTEILWINGEAHFIFTLLTSPFVGNVSFLSAINDRGEICGAGSDSDGVSCGVILRPIRTREGDVTIDCHVDARDITALFEFWGRTYEYDGGPGDLDGDRYVHSSDLALVLGDWGN